MFATETQLRVHYALTDLMGFVYHGHYAEFYEIGRAEAIRSLGITYLEIENMGVMMPVGQLHCKFLRPARYDDLLTVKTILKEMPSGSKIVFFHEIYNQKDELINTGEVTLHFLDKSTLKACSMPLPLQELIKGYFPRTTA
jgi:acyl-CoA thioester hydrolase